jgi:hypothetical protein
MVQGMQVYGMMFTRPEAPFSIKSLHLQWKDGFALEGPIQVGAA